MSRIRADLSRVSLNQLCTLTGKTSRTVKKALAGVPFEEEHGMLLYEPKVALPFIYQTELSASLDSGGGTQGQLNPVQEKARLDRARADKAEIEVKRLKGELIPIAEIELTWSKITSALKQRILAIPSKLAPRLETNKDPAEAVELVRKECNAALEELASYDPGSAQQSPSA